MKGDKSEVTFRFLPKNVKIQHTFKKGSFSNKSSISI